MRRPFNVRLWAWRYLRLRGVHLQPGLSEAEIKRVQRRFDFVFPPDLRSFLTEVLPTGRGFPDWRDGGRELEEYLSRPYEGLVWDGVWLPEWGPEPADFEPEFNPKHEALLRKRVSDVPTLIPVFMGNYAGRYVPDDPSEAGNPVFSMYTSDIMVWGPDLWSYMRREFAGLKASWGYCHGREIRFWSRLVELQYGSTYESPGS